MIDELQGKEEVSSHSRLEVDDDGDKNDYELFENEEKAAHDPIGKQIRRQEKSKKKSVK